MAFYADDWAGPAGAVALAAGFAAFLPMPAGRHWVRIPAAIMLAAILAPGAGARTEQLPAGLWISVTTAFALGCAFGFTLRGCLAALQAAAQLVEHQLGFAAGSDDPLGEQHAPITRLYQYLGIAVFLSCGGHRVVLDRLLGSFQAAAMPHDTVAALLLLSVQIVTHVCWFAMALAGPIAASLLAAHLTTGMLARLLPQFPGTPAMQPIHIACGLGLVFLSLAGFVPLVHEMLTWFEG